MQNLASYIKEYTLLCCDYLHLNDHAVRSRKEEIISIKHAVMYHVYETFILFTENGLHKNIAEIFGMHRSTMYHVIDKMNFALKYDKLKYPILTYYNTLKEIAILKQTPIRVVCKENISDCTKEHGYKGVLYALYPTDYVVLKFDSSDTYILFTDNEKFSKHFTLTS